MRRFIFFLATAFIVFLFQNSTAQQRDSLVKDSLVYHKVLLVEFDTMMYLSDAEQEIIEQSQKKPEAFHTYLRKSLDNKIAGEVEAIIPCYSMLNDKSEQASEFTAEIYGRSSYRYDELMKLKHVKSTKPKTATGKSKANEDFAIADQYVTVQGDANYMNAAIENKNLFERLNNQYGADLFLFINQLEIKTNYNNCIDIERHVYKRELIISYSVYDAKGKQVDGNLAHAFFPSDSNRDSDIAERTFPAIAQSIAAHIKALAIK